MIGGLEVEVRMAVFGGLSLVALLQRTVAADRGNTALGRSPGGVQLAVENGFGVGGFQYKAILAVAAFIASISLNGTRIKPPTKGPKPTCTFGLPVALKVAILRP